MRLGTFISPNVYFFCLLLQPGARVVLECPDYGSCSFRASDWLRVTMNCGAAVVLFGCYFSCPASAVKNRDLGQWNVVGQFPGLWDQNLRTGPLPPIVVILSVGGFHCDFF